jgi:hypothetical protein
VKIFLGFGRASKRILSCITPPTNKAKICALELPEHQEFSLLRNPTNKAKGFFALGLPEHERS